MRCSRRPLATYISGPSHCYTKLIRQWTDAITAADLLHRTTYATGTIRLRAFRAIAVRPLDPQTLRTLDDHLTHFAA